MGGDSSLSEMYVVGVAYDPSVEGDRYLLIVYYVIFMIAGDLRLILLG
jgi:hypothetical protein